MRKLLEISYYIDKYCMSVHDIQINIQPISKDDQQIHTMNTCIE
jgi:hypothetical protein